MSIVSCLLDKKQGEYLNISNSNNSPSCNIKSRSTECHPSGRSAIMDMSSKYSECSHCSFLSCILQFRAISTSPCSHYSRRHSSYTIEYLLGGGWLTISVIPPMQPSTWVQYSVDGHLHVFLLLNPSREMIVSFFIEIDTVTQLSQCCESERSTCAVNAILEEYSMVKHWQYHICQPQLPFAWLFPISANQFTVFIWWYCSLTGFWSGWNVLVMVDNT